MELRDEFAAKIIAGMCAGDWKFPAETPEEWDKIAVTRAYLLADAMMKEREIDNV